MKKEIESILRKWGRKYPNTGLYHCLDCGYKGKKFILRSFPRVFCAGIFLDPDRLVNPAAEWMKNHYKNSVSNEISNACPKCWSLNTIPRFKFFKSQKVQTRVIGFHVE